MPTENPRPERPADLGKKARNDLLYLARTERSMGNNLLASRIEEAVESLDAFRSFAIHQAEQIADLKGRLERKTTRLRSTLRVIAALEDEHTSADTREDVVRRLAEAILCDPELLHGHPDTEDTTGVAYEAAERIAAALDPPTGEDDRSVHGDLRPGFTFRELEGAMDAVAEGARREFLRGVGTTELRNALGKADDWGEVGLADLFAGELQRRGAGR